MNVLALYDIHGNVDALEAVLADERAGDADVVLVGGDAVPGPFAEHTLARLEALTIPVRWIRWMSASSSGGGPAAPGGGGADVMAMTRLTVGRW